MTVKLYSGELSGVGGALALEGRANMAIRGDDGAWEMFAFAEAELVAPDVWRLSRLLRGLGGEEALAARTVSAGARVVLLDRAVVPLASGLSSIGAEMSLRVGPADRDSGDASYVTVSATPTNKALLPYAPTRPRATESAEGIAISFIRRGRIDSDAWEPVDIPLGEDVEAYVVEIARPSGAPRVITGATQTILYPAADFRADFAAPPDSLDVTIRQMSVAGAGFPLFAHVPIE